MNAHISKRQSNQKNFRLDEESELLEPEAESTSLFKQYDGLSLYFASSRKPKPLSEGEDISLGKQIAESKDDEKREQARQRLAEGSLYLVIHLAKETQKQNGQLDIKDLVQAGYLGLMTAVDKYDYKQGVRFSTFSYWWIKKAIYESVNAQRNLVSLPKNFNEQIREYKKTSWQLRSSLGREPSLAEISSSMNLPLRKVELLAMAAHQDKMVYIDHLKSLDEPSSD